MLGFARELTDILKADGYEVIATRTDDSFVPLERRMTKARAAGADLCANLPPELRDSAPTAVATDWASALAQEADRLLAGGDGSVHETLTNRFERILIARALAHTSGRRIEAALALGIGRTTITRKIQELGLEGGRGDEGEHA